MAKSNSNFQKLFEAIHGVIFLGTPHNGAGAANFANVLLKVIGPLARSNKGFLEALKRGSEELRSLTEDFRGFSSSNIQVISVCEKKRTGSVGIVSLAIPGYEKYESSLTVLKVVPEESATLNWGNHKERVLSFDCDHNHLAQYKADDSDYRILVRGIRKMVEQAAKGLQSKPTILREFLFLYLLIRKGNLITAIFIERTRKKKLKRRSSIEFQTFLAKGLRMASLDS